MLTILQKLKFAGHLLGALSTCGLLSNCGVSTTLDLTEKLEVVMFGKLTAPDDATGESSPTYNIVTLEGLTVTSLDGTESDLFAAAETEATEFRIVGRSQIIFESDLTDLQSDVITTITATFNTDLTVGGAAEELSVTLPSGNVTHSEQFTVIKAKQQRLEIYVNWKNTLTTDPDTGTQTASAPSFASALNPD